MKKKLMMAAVLFAACACTTLAVGAAPTPVSSQHRILANDGGAPIPLCDPFKDPNCKLP